MRQRHPDMPLTVDEIVEEGGRKYAAEEEARYQRLTCLQTKAAESLSPSERKELEDLQHWWTIASIEFEHREVRSN
jgi:hypothetical protein